MKDAQRFVAAVSPDRYSEGRSGRCSTIENRGHVYNRHEATRLI